MAAVYRRGTIWWVRFRMGGLHVRRSAKTNKKVEAQAYLHRLVEEHSQIARGEVLSRHLLTEAMARFFDEASLKATTLEGYSFQSRTIIRLLGHLHLDEMNRRVLAEFVATRKRTGVTDATIRRDLAILGSVCSMAVRWGWIETSPIPAFNKEGAQSQPSAGSLPLSRGVRPLA